MKGRLLSLNIPLNFEILVDTGTEGKNRPASSGPAGPSKAPQTIDAFFQHHLGDFRRPGIRRACGLPTKSPTSGDLQHFPGRGEPVDPDAAQVDSRCDLMSVRGSAVPDQRVIGCLHDLVIDERCHRGSQQIEHLNGHVGSSGQAQEHRGIGGKRIRIVDDLRARIRCGGGTRSIPRSRRPPVG